MGRLAGRRALVTGAGMGIGQGCALALAREDAVVAVHYAHSAAGARETVEQVAAGGGQAVAIGGNLGVVAEARRVVDEAVAALGGLDILINNSGVTRAVEFGATSEAVYDEVFTINMRGMFFATQQALPHLVASGHGAVLILTSVHGFAGFPRHAAYAATKGAIIAFTRELAIELAPQRVRVNAIGPGLIEVPRYFDIPGYTTAMGDAMVPWGRVGTPADIGAAAVFLVSDAADFITGQVLYVDGGTTARMGLWWDQGNKPQ
jgi:glucose 1-dehydrogenase/3-oxoacyl-[acyl-carrier protein] reductase